MRNSRLPAAAGMLLAIALGLPQAGCGEQNGTSAPSGLSPNQPAAAAPNATPAAKQAASLKYSMVCLGCHGPDGHGQGPFPRLAGQPATALADKLKAYRAGLARGPASATMMPFAQPLSDEEIQSLAEYLASL